MTRPLFAAAALAAVLADPAAAQDAMQQLLDERTIIAIAAFAFAPTLQRGNGAVPVAPRP